jgi:hypothetical protein
MTEMFGMESVPPSPSLEGILWSVQSRLAQDIIDPLIPGRSQIGMLLKQLVDKTPHVAESRFHPLSAFLSAITETDDPRGREPEVVASLQEGLGGNSGKGVVAVPAQFLPQTQLIGIEQDLASDGLGEVSVRLFTDEQIGELAFGTEHGQLILGATILSDPQERSCNSQMIEGDVAESDIRLQVRCPGHPLSQPLGDNEVVISVIECGSHI